MFISRFRKKYGLELLPTSTADISLGDLIWKRSHRRARLAKRGMPSHIHNVFLNADLLTEFKWRKAMTALESAKTVPAQLGQLTVTSNQRFSHSFPHPTVQQLSHALQKESLLQFSFSALEVRTLSDFWRLDIQERMTEMTPEDIEENFQALRPVYIITQLFYGDIHFSIDKTLKHTLKPLLLDSRGSLQQTLETKKEIHYSFAHEDVPFAMRMEALDGFKG